MSEPERDTKIDLSQVEIVAPNFKRRLSGVTSTIIQLIPVQRARGEKIAALGPGLPKSLPHIRFRDLVGLWRPPEGRAHRVWHARRNIEMLPAILLRDLMRARIRILFTSASQRRHSGWTKWLIRRMDHVVATSAKTASYLELPSTVILHGIDTARFSPPADKTVAKVALGLDPALHYVGCFGRLRHQKGTDVFVDAMIRLLPERPHWAAIVAGRATAKHKDFETALKHRVEQAGLSDRILFVGEHTAINDWYRALDLFVAPQRWEGFGLTPLEAMASGVPVIATDVGAFPELLQAEPPVGTVIPAGDVAAMSTAAAALMDDDNLRLSLSEAALLHARQAFSIDRECAALAAVYAQLLSQPARQAGRI